MLNFFNQLPIKTIFYIIFFWILILLLNIFLVKLEIFNSAPILFPITVFYGPKINFTGIPFLLLFFIILVYAIRFVEQLTMYQLWLIGFSLIILGNLGQGDWDTAFLQPFYYGNMQYYHDAIKINSWNEWLESFNSYQRTGDTHTHTHPPMAVLIHFLFLKMTSNSLFFLSIIFVFISSLSIILVYKILKILDVPLVSGNLLTLLFSVIPAVNIYSAVSLEGLILTSSAFFLLGITILLKSKRLSLSGLSLITLGIIFTNLLTFGGIFLFAVVGLLAFREFAISRTFNVAFSFLISTVLFFAIIIVTNLIYNYNHFQAFITASSIENPNGFRGFYEPLKYLATRVTCIGEIVFFLSFGFLAILFYPKKLNISYFNISSAEMGIFYSSLITILLMLASGAFRTGEMARPAIFIYPFFLLTLSKADSTLLKDILLFAGVQTVLMQLLGNYFW